MIELVNWNIQWGRGMDGVVDLGRIVETVSGLSDRGGPDIICFQEVTRNLSTLAGPRSLSNGGADQPAVLAGLLPGFEAIYGPGTDLAGKGRGTERRQFGNLVLSRLPVAQVMAHLLPRPAAGGCRHLQRQALEVIVITPAGPLRVVNTHLEFHADAHRRVNIDRLRQLHREAFSHPLKPHSGEMGDDLYEPPFGPVPTLLCGDFNLDPADPDYGLILAPFDDGTPPFVDAWSTLHPGVSHPVTCNRYAVDPKEPPLCLDYVFVTPDLAGQLRSVDVDGDSTASDHQPVRVILEM